MNYLTISMTRTKWSISIPSRRLIDQLRAKPIMSQANPELSSKSQTMNIVSGLVMC